MTRFCLILLLLVSACGTPFAPEWRVEDLRVLAVAAEPPEVLDDLSAPNSLAPLDVRFSALVVSPLGPVSGTWHFCLVESSRACADEELILSRIQPVERALLDPARNINLAVPEMEAAAFPEFRVQMSAGTTRAFYAYHGISSLYGRGNGAIPSVILNLSAAGQNAETQKRLVVNLEDVRKLKQFEEIDLSGIGLGSYTEAANDLLAKLCADGEDPKLTGCLSAPPRTPNHNPIFDHIEFALGESALVEFEPVQGGALTLQAGEKVRIRPVLTEASAEPYYLLTLDLQSRALVVQNRIEEVSISWYCSAGDLKDPITWPKFTKTLDTTFTAPSGDKIPSGPVTVWMIARDQRGGTAWSSVAITVNP